MDDSQWPSYDFKKLGSKWGAFRVSMFLKFFLLIIGLGR